MEDCPWPTANATATAGAVVKQGEAPAPAPPPPTYRIGYALAPKKVESFIQPSLLNLAKQRCIHLVPVDLHQPLSHQGPFDCLLHKLSGPDWTQQLRHFSSLYPDVPIIDPPDAIHRLHDRVSMLQVVNDLRLPEEEIEFQSDESGFSSYSFGIPHQVLVPDAQLLRQQGLPSPLKFPVIAKPVLADGSASSHQMSLVFNRQGLEQLEEEGPMVLQEFVNHGGVVFKVYVVGEHVQCVRRRSLPDIIMEEDDKALGLGTASHHNHDLLTFSQISNLAASSSSSSKKNDEQKQIEEEEEAAQMPPARFLTGLSRALRKALGLHLFNFDVIRDSRYGNRYLVIDINYFPGYAKMPSYETVLTDFFLDLLLHPRKQ